MILLVLMSFILIAGYVFAMIKKMEEIPYSISDTYYALTHKFWFGLCMIGSGALLLPAALEASSENSQFLVFLGCVSSVNQFTFQIMLAFRNVVIFINTQKLFNHIPKFNIILRSRSEFVSISNSVLVAFLQSQAL